MRPIGYYVSAPSGHPDADTLDRIQEQYGGYLKGLDRDDKAAALVCLIEDVISPRQALIEPNFYSDSNGEDFYKLAEELEPGNKLKLAFALMSLLVDVLAP